MVDQLPYIKNFDAWNEHKKRIEKRTGPHAKPGEIWWTFLGLNIGHEQNGSGELHIRPCLILRSYPNRTCLVIPTSTNIRRISRPFAVVGMINNRQNSFLLSQARTIDMRRCDRILATMNPQLYRKIRTQFIDLL